LFLCNQQDLFDLLIWDWQQDSSVHDVNYEPFDSILCSNRSQKSQEISIQCSSNDVRMLRDQKSCHATTLSSNSHNQSTKKINDMSMSVRDEKILLVKKTTQIKNLRVMITNDQRICDSLTTSISKRLHHINNVIK